MSKEAILELVENVNDAMNKLCGYMYENDLNELSDKIQEAISPVETLGIEDFIINYENALNGAVEEYFNDEDDE